MAERKPMNPLEMVAFILAQQIHDHQVVYIGTGIPMMAAILAKKTHAPNITMVYESGAQDPLPGGMPWSVGCPFTWRKSPVVMEMAYSFAQCYNGFVDLAFLGFAQVDMYGNINTHLIGTVPRLQAPPDGFRRKQRPACPCASAWFWWASSRRTSS